MPSLSQAWSCSVCKKLFLIEAAALKCEQNCLRKRKDRVPKELAARRRLTLTHSLTRSKCVDDVIKGLPLVLKRALGLKLVIHNYTAVSLDTPDSRFIYRTTIHYTLTLPDYALTHRRLLRKGIVVKCDRYEVCSAFRYLLYGGHKVSILGFSGGRVLEFSHDHVDNDSNKWYGDINLSEYPKIRDNLLRYEELVANQVIFNHLLTTVGKEVDERALINLRADPKYAQLTSELHQLISRLEELQEQHRLYMSQFLLASPKPVLPELPRELIELEALRLKHRLNRLNQ